MQYMTFELLHVPLCFVMYSRLEALHVVLPVVLSFGQYLQFLVLQGLLGSVEFSLGGSLNFARNRICFMFGGFSVVSDIYL